MRVLKTPEGEIVLDVTGRKNGRGAYLCFSKECLQKAIKNKGIAAFMVACSVLTAYFVPTAHTDSSIIMEEAVKEGATNPLNAPSGFAAPQTNDAAETPAPGDSAQ